MWLSTAFSTPSGEDVNWEHVFVKLSEARNFTPEQISNMTLNQVRIYLMKVDGFDGVEHMHDLENLKKARSKKDPRVKIVNEICLKAARNLCDGLPWNSNRE